MVKVNYITRPWFFDISIEFIKELKEHVELHVILIIAPATLGYLGISKTDGEKYLNKTLNIKDVLKGDNALKFAEYFDGANVFCKFEQHKETNYHNALAWIKLLSKNKNLLKADYTIIESLSLADWYFLLRFINKKLAYIIHDPIAHSGEERGRVDKLNNIYFPYINQFFTYSEFAGKLFKQNFPKYKNLVSVFQMPVYHSLNLGGKQPAEVKSKVVFFGRISPYKGVELFYKAASNLANRYPATAFIIAGKTIDDYHPAFLSDNPHNNITIINKFIDLDELYELMNDASFCVLPYLDATQSGVIMTAYAFNLPVLVSDCEGLLEYCFNTTHFSFKNGDAADLETKMEKLLNSGKLLAENKIQIANYNAFNISEKNVRTLLNALTVL
ncbi:glycosyltransferase family 4 protein [Pedobacter alpinus]|uniref:Glycosyltransferase family 4 protein n=1 Tax=Pedobacter alpinus TaxID=1590643 RepID=A0ABW5TTC4_9SPHI